MDLDTLLIHFFGTVDIDAVDEPTLDTGRERALIAVGTERDGGRRFAIWTLLHAAGGAPDPATAFEDPRERKAAEDYARVASRMERS